MIFHVSSFCRPKHKTSRGRFASVSNKSRFSISDYDRRLLCIIALDALERSESEGEKLNEFSEKKKSFMSRIEIPSRNSSRSSEKRFIKTQKIHFAFASSDSDLKINRR